MKTKRMIRALLLALLLTAILCSAASAATLGVVRMPSKDGTVHLRPTAGMSGAPIGYAQHGDLLEIKKDGKSWDRVTMRSGVSQGRTGWMYDKYITNLRNISDISGWGALAHIKTKYINSTVNLRKGPGTSYGVKDTLKRGDMLIVLDKYNSDWYEVQVIGSLRTGYIFHDYIANGVAGTTTANVNLRSRGSNSASILEVIPNGSSITVLTVGKNWSKVRNERTRRTGYIYNKYFRIV